MPHCLTEPLLWRHLLEDIVSCGAMGAAVATDDRPGQSRPVSFDRVVTGGNILALPLTCSPHSFSHNLPLCTVPCSSVSNRVQATMEVSPSVSTLLAHVEELEARCAAADQRAREFVAANSISFFPDAASAASAAQEALTSLERHSLPLPPAVQKLVQMLKEKVLDAHTQVQQLASKLMTEQCTAFAADPASGPGDVEAILGAAASLWSNAELLSDDAAAKVNLRVAVVDALLGRLQAVATAVLHSLLAPPAAAETAPAIGLQGEQLFASEETAALAASMATQADLSRALLLSAFLQNSLSQGSQQTPAAVPQTAPSSAIRVRRQLLLATAKAIFSHRPSMQAALSQFCLLFLRSTSQLVQEAAAGEEGKGSSSEMRRHLQRLSQLHSVALALRALAESIEQGSIAGAEAAGAGAAVVSCRPTGETSVTPTASSLSAPLKKLLEQAIPQMLQQDLSQQVWLHTHSAPAAAGSRKPHSAGAGTTTAVAAESCSSAAVGVEGEGAQGQGGVCLLPAVLRLLGLEEGDWALVHDQRAAVTATHSAAAPGNGGVVQAEKAAPAPATEGEGWGWGEEEAVEQEELSSWKATAEASFTSSGLAICPCMSCHASTGGSGSSLSLLAACCTALLQACSSSSSSFHSSGSNSVLASPAYDSSSSSSSSSVVAVSTAAPSLFPASLAHACSILQSAAATAAEPSSLAVVAQAVQKAAVRALLSQQAASFSLPFSSEFSEGHRPRPKAQSSHPSSLAAATRDSLTACSAFLSEGWGKVMLPLHLSPSPPLPPLSAAAAPTPAAGAVPSPSSPCEPLLHHHLQLLKLQLLQLHSCFLQDWQALQREAAEELLLPPLEELASWEDAEFAHMTKEAPAILASSQERRGGRAGAGRQMRSSSSGSGSSKQAAEPPFAQDCLLQATAGVSSVSVSPSPSSFPLLTVLAEAEGMLLRKWAGWLVSQLPPSLAQSLLSRALLAALQEDLQSIMELGHITAAASSFLASYLQHLDQSVRALATDTELSPISCMSSLPLSQLLDRRAAVATVLNGSLQQLQKEFTEGAFQSKLAPAEIAKLLLTLFQPSPTLSAFLDLLMK